MQVKNELFTKELLYGDLLCLYLEAVGVKYAFGIPGGAIETFYNALARSQRRGGIEHILVRHEANAAFAAQGYYEQTGKLAVAIATSGPGATNLITGVSGAFVREVPLIVITGQTRLETFGRGAAQESTSIGVNAMEMFDFCTRYNTLISHVDQLETQILSAIEAAYQMPRGPVHLSLPRNLLDVPLSPAALKNLKSNLEKIQFDSYSTQMEVVDLNAINRLIQIIKDKKKIVLYVGTGCGKAVDQILEFANLLNIEVITTPKGKKCFPNNHPHYHGVFGFAGHQSGENLLKNPDIDYVMLVGEFLSDTSSDGWNPILFEKNIIHIDDREFHFRSTPAAQHILSSIPLIFESLNRRLKEEGYQARRQELLPSASPLIILDNKENFDEDHSPYKPEALVRDLVDLLPEDTFFIGDVGNSFMWMIHYLFPKKVNNLFISINWGAMGVPFGYSIGCKMGSPDKPVVAIVGDGSFLMLGSEVTTAVQEKLPIIYVVLNDHSLGMVRHGQRLIGDEQIATELSPVNFAMLAESFGAKGIIVSTPREMKTINFKEILAGDTPLIIDVHIDRESVPPIGSRVKAMKKTDSPDKLVY